MFGWIEYLVSGYDGANPQVTPGKSVARQEQEQIKQDAKVKRHIEEFGETPFETERRLKNEEFDRCRRSYQATGRR